MRIEARCHGPQRRGYAFADALDTMQPDLPPNIRHSTTKRRAEYLAEYV